jgi:hypothetical protein
VVRAACAALICTPRAAAIAADAGVVAARAPAPAPARASTRSSSSAIAGAHVRAPGAPRRRPAESGVRETGRKRGTLLCAAIEVRPEKNPGSGIGV